MGSVFAINGAKAKTAGETHFPKKEGGFTVSEKIVSVIKAAWPKKTTQHAAYVTGCDERTVRFWLAGETRLSMDAVTALLRSAEGFEVLAAIMGDAKPKWWIATQMAQELRVSRAELKRQERRKAALVAQYSLLEEQ